MHSRGGYLTPQESTLARHAALMSSGAGLVATALSWATLGGVPEYASLTTLDALIADLRVGEARRRQLVMPRGESERAWPGAGCPWTPGAACGVCWEGRRWHRTCGWWSPARCAPDSASRHPGRCPAPPAVDGHSAGAARLSRSGRAPRGRRLLSAGRVRRSVRLPAVRAPEPDRGAGQAPVPRRRAALGASASPCWVSASSRCRWPGHGCRAAADGCPGRPAGAV